MSFFIIIQKHILCSHASPGCLDHPQCLVSHQMISKSKVQYQYFVLAQMIGVLLTQHVLKNYASFVQGINDILDLQIELQDTLAKVKATRGYLTRIAEDISISLRVCSSSQSKSRTGSDPGSSGEDAADRRPWQHSQVQAHPRISIFQKIVSERTVDSTPKHCRGYIALASNLQLFSGSRVTFLCSSIIVVILQIGCLCH